MSDEQQPDILADFLSKLPEPKVYRCVHVPADQEGDGHWILCDACQSGLAAAQLFSVRNGLFWLVGGVFTKPEQLTRFKVPSEAFWLIERMAGGDGYDVMDVATRHRWLAVPAWGSDGWDFLEWPYYVGYVRNTPDGFEFATNCEGDVDVWRFPTLEMRQAAMDLWAFLHWQHKGRAWVAGVSADDLPAHLRGPYLPERVILTPSENDTGGAAPTG